ncbi:MAG: F0F1 ATP synthase subunit B [Clostridia bacterium]|nr:F0F1 ATP synthase subunit B [Clostridia bacterium]
MLDALGLDLKEIIFVIINFLILVGILGKLIYKPFLGALENRKKAIQDKFDAADAESRRADAKMAKYERRISHAEEEARSIIKEAKKAADIQAQSIIDEANVQAAEIIAKAEEAIEMEKNKAREDMREEIAALALLAAEQIVQGEISKTGQDAIVEQVLNNARSAQWQN